MIASHPLALHSSPQLRIHPFQIFSHSILLPTSLHHSHTVTVLFLYTFNLNLLISRSPLSTRWWSLRDLIIVFRSDGTSYERVSATQAHGNMARRTNQCETQEAKRERRRKRTRNRASKAKGRETTTTENPEQTTSTTDHNEQGKKEKIQTGTTDQSARLERNPEQPQTNTNTNTKQRTFPSADTM